MKPSTATLVWIDAEQAVLCHWDGEAASVETVTSTVPAHRRSTGHVRRSPTDRHGGGGAQDAGEPHRLEHLRGFLAEVARKVPPDDVLQVIGPGTVHERLAVLLADDDRESGRIRPIRSGAAGRLSERQLRARLQELGEIAVPRRGMPGS
jgi:hypothetical protein